MSELSNGFVCLMGMGTVFIGLICIIILCALMSAVIRSSEKKKASEETDEKIAAPTPIQNRQEIIAAVSAALAEELGEDAKALRIVSFKKI